MFQKLLPVFMTRMSMRSPAMRAACNLSLNLKTPKSDTERSVNSQVFIDCLKSGERASHVSFYLEVRYAQIKCLAIYSMMDVKKRPSKTWKTFAKTPFSFFQILRRFKE